MVKHLVFVYGTLKKGKSNHDFLKDSKFLNDAKIHGVTMYNLGHYPALVLSGHASVSGEVYRVNSKTLEHLDHLEGHPVFYRREFVGLSTGQEAWTYFLVRSGNHYPVILKEKWE